MGSVKDIQEIKKASPESPGEGIFHFSDRYSAFDWGEMPDHIQNKGAALCMMSAFNFELLEKNGVKTHYLGVVDNKGNTVTAAELAKKGEYSSKMAVSLVEVLSPENDYSVFSKKNNNFLIPLEIVFRNGLPQGSSVFKKIALAKAKGNLAEVLKALGLSNEPIPGQMLPKPVYDFWTKLETTDRLLSLDEAKRISGLGGRFNELFVIAEKVNSIVTTRAEKQGMMHYDGKIECVYSNDEILVADTVGTLDEDRFAFNGIQISKQLLRNAYLKTPWHKDLEKAKTKVGKLTENLHEVCQSKPEKLPAEFVTLISEVYQSACNQYTGQKTFEVAELKELTAQLKQSQA